MGDHFCVVSGEDYERNSKNTISRRTRMNNHSDHTQATTREESFRIFSRNPKEREVLRQKHLVIVGAGSVGSAIALMAARAGVGKFTLIDPDELAPENICRHFCDLSQIGRCKAYAVSELI